jgi:hypothetical protein
MEIEQVEEIIVDSDTEEKEFDWLKKYRTTPVLRRCFDSIFIHFSLLDWITLKSVCKSMKMEKTKIMEFHREAKPPSGEEESGEEESEEEE